MNTDEYKNKLVSELAIIDTELKTIAAFNEASGDWEAKPEAPADASDSNLAADTAEDSIERQAAVSDLETRFRNVSLAILKIESDTFGYCELCKQPIEENRLEANPAARTCIADREKESELSL